MAGIMAASVSSPQVVSGDSWEVVNKDIVSGSHLHDPGVWAAGKTGSYQACQDLCESNASCTSCDWAGHALDGVCKWASTCYFRSDSLWLPHANGKCNHTAGRPRPPPGPPAPPAPPAPAPSTCGTHPCSDDSDCSSLPGCTWCRDDVPGKKNPMACGGPPGPEDCGTAAGACLFALKHSGHEACFWEQVLYRAQRGSPS